MNSAWYGLAMVAIFLVVYWFVVNDTLPDGQTKGIFAMILPGEGVAGRKKRGRGKFSLKDPL